MLNSTNTVISAQDYDAWGYRLENRTYNANAMKYDFTGKERDDETNYDYFGARYYDSRIANWTSIDPLFEKHYSFSPYNYVLRSPLILVDPDGMQTNLHTYQLSDENLSTSSDYRAIGESYDDEAVRKGRKHHFTPQPGILEAEVMDPVDILTGIALAKIGFKLTGKFVFKEGVESTSKYSITELVGKASDIGLESFKGKIATKESAELLGKKLKSFLGEVSSDLVQPKERILKVGSLKKLGKEVRIGFDKIHPFDHIDVEKWATGKKWLETKLKIVILKK